MPKETLNGSFGDKVIVGWDKEVGHGQLAVDLGRPFVFTSDLAKVGTKEGAEEFSSLYFTFEHRDDYNRLIKLLRKARDGAFGKDA